MKWEDKEKQFGKPKKNKIYVCKIKHYSSGDIQSIELKAVKEDDVMWRTTDDNSELNEMSWDVIEWVEKN